MSETGPRPPSLWSIPAGVPFVDALAAGVLAQAGTFDPLALSRWTLLLPTRRACRSLRDAFLRQGGGRPLLLPRLVPLGDVDEDEIALESAALGEESRFGDAPAIGRLRRQLLLTRTILAGGGFAGSAAQAAGLAAELGRLLDELQSEGLDLSALAGLVPDEHARHWQITLSFLAILEKHWPAILAEEGASDIKHHQTARLRALAALWQAAPPPGPVVAAGSTGSIPATADLLKVIAQMPQGRVVLPGFDAVAAAEGSAALGEAHPQFGMARLIEHVGARAADVAPWPLPDSVAGSGPAERRVLLAEAMRPAATTEAWRDLQGSLTAAAMQGLRRLDAQGPREEAGAIALALREALSVPGRTAALITPDRKLARRVAQALRRWHIEVDDSAGVPLGDTPPGAFLRLVADLLVSLAPVPLLAVLKHPLAALGLDAAECRRRVRDLERATLRGPRPAEGIAGLREALAAAEPRRFATKLEREALERFIDRLERGLAPLLGAQPTRPLADWLQSHMRAAEALAATDRESGADRLWNLEAGEAAARLMAELLDAGHDFPTLTAGAYAGLFDALLRGAVVRPPYGTHPRLHILGLMEARLQQFDLVVLGGLNEGSWPPETDADPWLSRPMRAALGLPSPERRIGLTAHDFVQAASAPEVLLTRAAKVDGTPTVTSRWLLRLDAVLAAAGITTGLPRADHLGHWNEAMDRPAAVRPCPPPEPRPPIAARPRKLSVTQIETWMRDPYAIYARHVLRLEALDPLDADPGAAERGEFIHQALDRFVARYPDTLPPDGAAELRAMGRAAFGRWLDNPGVVAFWWPRFERIADWFLELETARRGHRRPAATEVKGSLALAGPAGPFLLTARADRIDRDAQGGLAIIDYKTGRVPSQEEIRLGLSPQLPLEAAMAEEGGFAGVDAGAVAALEFWRLTGGDPAGTIEPVKGDAAALAREAREGLEILIRSFDDPTTPYWSEPRPDGKPRFSHYTHLARLAEWQGGRE